MCELDDSLTEIDWLHSLKIRTPNSNSNNNLIVEKNKPSDCLTINNEICINKTETDNIYVTQHLQPMSEVKTLSSGYVTECNGHQKPSYSYAYMIKMAIESTNDKRMKLSDIYEWIMEKFPYYKFIKSDNNKGWKNAIRHNLSLNKLFKRCPKESHHLGKGSYWTLDSSETDSANVQCPPTKKIRRNSNSMTNTNTSSYNPPSISSTNSSHNSDPFKTQLHIDLNTTDTNSEIPTKIIGFNNSQHKPIFPYSTKQTNVNLQQPPQHSTGIDQLMKRNLFLNNNNNNMSNVDNNNVSSNSNEILMNLRLALHNSTNNNNYNSTLYNETSASSMNINSIIKNPNDPANMSISSGNVTIDSSNNNNFINESDSYNNFPYLASSNASNDSNTCEYSYISMLMKSMETRKNKMLEIEEYPQADLPLSFKNGYPTNNLLHKTPVLSQINIEEPSLSSESTNSLCETSTPTTTSVNIPMVTQSHSSTSSLTTGFQNRLDLNNGANNNNEMNGQNITSSFIIDNSFNLSDTFAQVFQQQSSPFDIDTGFTKSNNLNSMDDSDKPTNFGQDFISTPLIPYGQFDNSRVSSYKPNERFEESLGLSTNAKEYLLNLSGINDNSLSIFNNFPNSSTRQSIIASLSGRAQHLTSTNVAQMNANIRNREANNTTAGNSNCNKEIGSDQDNEKPPGLVHKNTNLSEDSIDYVNLDRTVNAQDTDNNEMELDDLQDDKEDGEEKSIKEFMELKNTLRQYKYKSASNNQSNPSTMLKKVIQNNQSPISTPSTLKSTTTLKESLCINSPTSESSNISLDDLANNQSKAERSTDFSISINDTSVLSSTIVKSDVNNSIFQKCPLSQTFDPSFTLTSFAKSNIETPSIKNSRFNNVELSEEFKWEDII